MLFFFKNRRTRALRTYTRWPDDELSESEGTFAVRSARREHATKMGAKEVKFRRNFDQNMTLL